MKNNPSQLDKERALAEVVCEVARNIFAAASLAGWRAQGYDGEDIHDLAFNDAEAMMKRSRLPVIIDIINEKQNQ